MFGKAETADQLWNEGKFGKTETAEHHIGNEGNWEKASEKGKWNKLSRIVTIRDEEEEAVAEAMDRVSRFRIRGCGSYWWNDNILVEAEAL